MRRYARICEVCELTEISASEYRPAGWRAVEVATHQNSASKEVCSLECAEVALVRLWEQLK